MPTSAAESLNLFFRAIQLEWLPFLGAICGIGTLAMAIIETAKNATPIRLWFQEAYLRQWFGTRAAMAPVDKGAAPNSVFVKPPNVPRAISDLIKLATAGDAHAFYSLPIDQLCGQANAAAQAIMDYPDEYPDLLRCLAALAELSDLATVVALPPIPNPDPVRIANSSEARAHVSSQVQRSLDGFQISVADRWQTWLQYTAFGLSALLTWAALSFYPISGHSAVKGVILALAGGFLAPFARDVMAAVQNLRP
jgi:hypothetical protein